MIRVTHIPGGSRAEIADQSAWTDCGFAAEFHSSDRLPVFSGTDLSNFMWTFGNGYGVSLGAEYLLNKHIGLSVDFLFRFSMAELAADSGPFSQTNGDRHLKILLNYQSAGPNDHPKVEVRPSMFGFDAAVNFYFLK